MLYFVTTFDKLNVKHVHFIFGMDAIEIKYMDSCLL